MHNKCNSILKFVPSSQQMLDQQMHFSFPLSGSLSAIVATEIAIRKVSPPGFARVATTVSIFDAARDVLNK